MTAPQISVVMPIGSVDAHLGDQLAALGAQCTRRPWELVLSLNAPLHDELDRAVEPLRSSRPELPITIVDSSAVRSASHARNVGAAAAAADRLAFCDGDDIAEPGWLEALSAALDDHRAVGGQLDEERLAVPGQEHWRPPATPGDNPTFLGHPYLVSANMAVETALFRSVGGFDESLLRGEDIAFAWAVQRHGAELGFAPDAVVAYRHRKGLRPMLRQHFLYGRGMSQVLARHGAPGGPPGGVNVLKANAQPVDQPSLVHVLRRGSLAAGRLVGLLGELPRRRRRPPST